MSRRRGSLHAASLEDQGINLMPLIDVIFVVLVMFIIIAPMVNIDRIELASGLPSIEQNKVDQSITVHIRKDNSIWVNQHLVTVFELPTVLKQAKKERPDVIPQIMPDKKASFQAYEHVRSAAKEAGYDCIDVNLSP